MKQIQPLPLKQKYYKNIEKEINKLFYEVMYRDIIRAISNPRESFSNALGDDSHLSKAISSGRVWVDGSTFHGSYNSKISKELRRLGATYNKKAKTWSITGSIPANLAAAQVQSASKFKIMQGSILSVLDRLDVDAINDLSTIPDDYIDTITAMERDFQRSVKGIAIAPKMTEGAKNVIASEWGQNLDLYIKNWSSQNIIQLRKDIAENTFNGKRSSQIAEHIQRNYGVSKRKATFLARQETSLLMGKFRETRYKDIGVNKYRWSGAMDSRERQDHKDLEGNVYTWDNPPVVDQKTGRRAHPTEDFGCRCVAIGLID